ncbi:DUF4183 domain-containing protein [Lysinibacillus agricola]|uniref:DUF4183 domain-containing protein n=1 Tax=Lysinibacillus agricola TaxID=2590012 RepID=A0ABX7AXF7_9BACI|nr:MULTISPECIES: DUF4183 domain-containing protein [Lysinibacillus]KOS63477.1 hypothetical protein AN161_07410 [Lysinibacillus sp. FJAT-14222]QQP14182.1 DUF4183 domain-containing protein [Lysinibacillus agricola]
MVNHRNHRKIERQCACDCEDRFTWPRIKAIAVSSIPPPPVNFPDGTIIPTINRYFYIVTSDINLTNGATLAVSQFWDDNGNPATEFMIFNPNGYVNLYINAVMQEGGIYTLTPTSLTLSPDNSTIYRGTPIIIESLGFSTK